MLGEPTAAAEHDTDQRASAPLGRDREAVLGDGSCGARVGCAEVPDQLDRVEGDEAADQPRQLADEGHGVGGVVREVSYTGIEDSNPYAVTGLHDGSWLVADAGANAILRVSKRGHVSTFAVLPPQTVKITDQAIAAGAPAACKGVTYRFEAVPTDVEVGPHGIYVTTLPGGAGGAGSVYKVGWGGSVKRIATGFVSATNLAVSPHGTIYVAELFLGRISVVKQGGPQPVAELPAVAAVEWANGRLYASTAPAIASEEPPAEGQAPPPGAVVVLG